MKRKFDWVLFGFVLAFLPYRLGAEEGWQPLFNGKDLSGWEHVGPGSFVVEDGMLKTVGGMGLLWYTREKIGNSVLRVVYKATHREDNAGVFIRISDAPPDEWFAVHNGYEVQIFGATSPEQPNDPWHTTGSIYSISKATSMPSKPAGEWNTIAITLDGPRTLVMLNGEKVNDFREGDPIPPRKKWFEPQRRPRREAGYIGLQNHHAGAEVYFKEVLVKPLAK